MPEFIFETDTAIPEELRSVATKNETGKFVLNLVQKTKLDEFRENNIKVSKERDDFKSKYDVLSPIVGEDVTKFKEELEALRTVDRQVKDGSLKKSTDIDSVLEQRTAQMKTSFEEANKKSAAEIAALTNENGQLKKRLNNVHIDRAVTTAVLNEKSGAEPLALPHILMEAYKVFHADEDGKVIPKNGDAIVYGTNGTDPMTADEWLVKIRTQFPYFFKNSSGGGATGGADKLNGMTKDSFAKLTPQQKLALANRKK
jgi:hypothetical protein